MLDILHESPERLLKSCVHNGLDWVVLNNLCGYRCGYIKLPIIHPWVDLDIDKIPTKVHGGITYSSLDTEDPNYFWIGFDAHHGGKDLPDISLPHESEIIKACNEDRLNLMNGYRGQTVKDTNFMEQECIKLCNEANAVLQPI